MMRAGSLILATGLVTLLGACVYDPAFEGIGCRYDLECPEGYWCAGSGEVKFCTSFQPDAGEPDAGDLDDGGPDEDLPDADTGPDEGDPGTDAADESDPGPADDGGVPDEDCLEPDRDGDGYESLRCGGNDCDDDNTAIHPGIQEGPLDSPNCHDGLDNNCNGQIDLEDPGCAVDWWSLDFRRRRKITFDNSGQLENLVNFPVLITLSGGANGRIDYAHTQDQGQDLRFVDADGDTLLAHEIESWNESATSYVWVKVPRIEAASDSDYIWMYYGNPQATDWQQASQVWSQGYRAVYHLHDDLADSTGSYPGSDQNTANSEGRVAAGREFLVGGFNSYVDMGEQLDILRNVSAVTLSAWVHVHAFVYNTQCVIWISRPKQNTVDQAHRARALLCLLNTMNVEVGGRSRDNEEYQQLQTLTAPMSMQEWRHLTGVIDYAGDQMRIYVDGELVREATIGFARETTSDTASPRATIGSHADHAQFFLDGMLDEIRVSATARTDDWIHAQHLSMVDQFLIFHGEESLD